MTDDAKARVRREFPTVAQIADQVRGFFGPGVKLLHGVEPDGREVGKVPEYMREDRRD